jgi:predicted PurR-regulated permease PerM
MPTLAPHGWSTGLRALTLLAAFALVTGCFYLAQAFLLPIAVSVLLAFLLTPVVAALQRWGLGRLLSVLVVVLLAFAVLAGIGVALGTRLTTLAHELPRYRANIREKIADVRWLGRGGAIEKVQETVESAAREAEEDQPSPAPQRARPTPVVVERETTGTIWSLPAALAPWLAPLGGAALVAVLVPFMLYERQELRNRVIRALGYRSLTVTTRALDEAARRVSRYLLMQTIVNSTFGGLVAVGLWLIGVPYALLWGAFAAVLRFIPYVGPWLAAIMPIALSLAVFPGWTRPLLVVALILVLELFSNMVMETLLYAQSAGVSEVALLVSVAFWTWLWGPVGLLLATPMTVVLVVFAKHVPSLAFVSVLAGDDAPLEPDVAFYQRILAGDQDEAVEIVEEYAKTHPLEELFDAVLVPALARARADRARDALSDEEERHVVQRTAEVLDALEETVIPAAAARDTATGPAAVVEVLGCPARDATDALALRMLGYLLQPTASLRVAPAGVLAAELLDLVAEQVPGAVVVGALGPGGLTHVRYLVKRLRGRFPDLRLVVGRWGVAAEEPPAGAPMVAPGIDAVGLTLVETRDRALELARLEPAEPGAERALA